MAILNSYIFTVLSFLGVDLRGALMNWIFWLSIILVVLFWIVFHREKIAYQERTDLYSQIENIGDNAINTVQGRITKAINEAVESIQEAHLSTITNEIKALKGSTTQAISTKVAFMKAEFKKDTKDFFNTNLDNHIQAAQECIKDLQEQKVDIQHSFQKLEADYLKLEESRGQLYDKLIDPYGRLLLNAYNKGLKFYSLPDSDPDFDSYLCQSTNTFHKVPKDFSKWQASDTSLNINFLFVNYVNIDNGDSIAVPAELLHIIKTVEGQPLTRAVDGNDNENENTNHPAIAPINPAISGPDELIKSPIFNLLVCPVCGKQHTDEQHTKMHLIKKDDPIHEEFRNIYPDFAKQFNSIS